MFDPITILKTCTNSITRLRDYTPAIKYCERVLDMEPGNQQATQLMEIIKKKRKKDAMIGAAVLGLCGYAIT